MKTLSLTQPWASLVAIGAKKIETRSWSTSYRGPLAIHAAKGFPRDARDLAACRMVLDLMRPYVRDDQDYLKQLPLGKVIATCTLSDVVRTKDILSADSYPRLFTAQEEALGNYDEGRYGWILSDVKMLPSPDPATGHLSLWEWDSAHYWKMREDFGPNGDATTPGFFTE